MDRTLRALNRFGLGARIGEAQRIEEPREWLHAQLDTRPDMPTVTASLSEMGTTFSDLREAQRSRDQERVAEARGRLREIQTGEANAMLQTRVTTDAPFVERLVAFWSNHLCVSVAAKPQVALLAGDYERRVIRPHVLGRFEDMVLASARHPAMLFYLDNFQSIGPGSRGARQGARRGNQRGLNENYARELLELHTVGVNGGYEQEDVEQLARVLTGWTVAGLGPGSRAGEVFGFVFRPQIHEPGDKTVLGTRYREGGVEEGERVIRDLCAHPATARFVANKMVRHFVADDPPPAAVGRIEDVFLDSGGDLRAVSAALVDLDEAWLTDERKFRTPQEWLIAVFRAFRSQEAPQQMGPLLRQLRHTAWAPAAPKGYGDTRNEWADPDALMNRAELARSLAGRFGRRRGIDPTLVLDVVDVEADDPLRTLLADTTIASQERMALAIGGPAFQWR